MKVTVIVTLLIFILLLVRIGYIQFVDGAYLKELAYQQQSINQIISPKRGNIYDSTGMALAISAQVDTITINPTKITDKDEDDFYHKMREVMLNENRLMDLMKTAVESSTRFALDKIAIQWEKLLNESL